MSCQNEGAILLNSARDVQANEARSGPLEIDEVSVGRHDVTRKVPIFQGQLFYLRPCFAEYTSVVSSPGVRDIPGARIETRAMWRLVALRSVLKLLSTVCAD